MGSWVTCSCGNLLHKNLFTGTGVHVVVLDDVLDGFSEDDSAGDCVSEIIRQGELLVRCRQCGRILIEDKTGCIVAYLREQ